MLAYSLISHAFYKFMDQVQYRYHNDFNYLLPQDISPPNIHPYLWTNYRKNPHFIHETNFIL